MAWYSIKHRIVAPNREVLVVASDGVVVELTAEETKYKGMSGDQNAGQNHNMKRLINPLEDIKYLGIKLTNQNSIQGEIKSRLKPRNACYHLGQNLLSSSLLPKNVKIKLYRTAILPFVL
jgi:hypothetical protein